MIARQPKHITVSDHAVLRWLERVEGVDVKAIRRRIARATRKGAELGASAVTLDGVRFAIHQAGDQAGVWTVYSPQARTHLAEPRQQEARSVATGRKKTP